MIVPNYVPDPIEVPGNVTEQPYRQRLVFIRRVSVLHLASIAWVAAVVTVHPPAWPLRLAIGSAVGCTLVLSLIRIFFRGQKLEVALSVGLLPLLLTLLGLAADSLARQHFPVWVPGVSCLSAVIYTMLCGRDFSFVGQFFLSWIASTLLIAAIALGIGLDHRQAAVGLGLNILVLFYYSYDLASLLSRRRVGEELAGVVDLYRDVLNVFGWTIRVAQHWFRHGIFTIPLIEPRKPSR